MTSKIELSQRYGQRPHILLLDSRGVIAFEFHDHELVRALQAHEEAMETCHRNLHEFAVSEGLLIPTDGGWIGSDHQTPKWDWREEYVFRYFQMYLRANASPRPDASGAWFLGDIEDPAPKKWRRDTPVLHRVENGGGLKLV